MAGFEKLVLRAVQYCEGNPLALEVLGSSLFMNDVENWTSQLTLSEKEIDSRVQGVLIRSYESLPSDTLKGLFLHIACFFNGIDMDYVANILEPDYSAISGIKTLIQRSLLSLSSNKNIIMHRLVQEMGKNIVRQESIRPEKRSRVWLSSDSYKILGKRMVAKKVEGFALDIKKMLEENLPFKSLELKTDALINMDRLKLLQLNFVELNGSYENFPEDLKWLCCFGFPLRSIPSNLYMGTVVAIDMSYSKLEVFEPSMVILSLKILNLKDSHHLLEIRNIFMFPNLETLILWNCYGLVNVCKTIGGLGSLTLLNMIGCKHLFNREQMDLSSASASASDTKHHIFSFPSSLHRLFLKDCHLDYPDSFNLTFCFQPDLQYLNLGNSLFESLPFDNHHLENLRVLDLSFCTRLKCLKCLPNTLAELYIYGCELLERITFQSPRFTLQEFGYLGCIHLYEVEGFMKLVPIAKLDETELGHMKWLQQYEHHQVFLVGDDELTTGRSLHIQMLYEFGIMSTSLPDINDPNMTPEYISDSSSLSFDVPSCPKNKRLKGINVTFKYSISGDDWAWFCKVNTTNGVLDLMYNPKVFGRPEFGELCIWLSYWPIGNTLNTGDTLNVSIVVMSGLEVHECSVSLVYSDQETIENNMGQEEILGGDLSQFQLSTGAYYLCRRDFFELLEVGRLTPDWFSTLLCGTIDYTEVRGWRKTGRPRHLNPSFTELKTVRCIIHGPQLEDIYKIADMSKSSIGDKTVAFTSTLLEERIINERMGKTVDFEFASDEIESFPSSPEIYDKQIKSPDETVGRISYSATGEAAQPCRLFSLEEILSATKNFDDRLVLGEGGFGKIYKGYISGEQDSHVVAIKRFGSTSDEGEAEFRAEIDVLCKFRHSHVVSLIGYCEDNRERIIVYEYMKNGSLKNHLHDADIPLSWVSRLRIAIDAARGLEYLHAGVGTQHGVIHGDVKSSNILISENWEAVISGFGLGIIFPTNQSEFSAVVRGTLGYIDPQYFNTGKLTWKTDVFSFGVVLCELLSGKSALYKEDKEGDYCSLVSWAQKCVKKGKLDQMVDPNMKGTISTKCLKGFTQIANRCVHDDSSKRPTMSEIVASLEALLELQEKSNRSRQSVIPSFAGKIFNYIVPTAKPTSAETETSSQKSLDKKKNEDDERESRNVNIR